MKDPPPAHPPTPPPLNVPSPTPSVRSTKVEASTPLPPRSVLLKLVEIYFTHVNNQTYGFLHRPTFLRHIEEGKVPEGLLYSICAISARFSATHAPPPLPRHSTKETPAYHAGEPYAIEARRLALRDFDKPTVQNVQTLLLLALHDFGGKKGQKAWMFAGMAIRMASALRLNREVDGDAIGSENSTTENVSQQPFGLPEAPRPKEKVSWTEREVRRRTFWACFIMDVNAFGIPNLTFSDSIQLGWKGLMLYRRAIAMYSSQQRNDRSCLGYPSKPSDYFLHLHRLHPIHYILIHIAWVPKPISFE
jgi:hypothetical protein